MDNELRLIMAKAFLYADDEEKSVFARALLKLMND